TSTSSVLSRPLAFLSFSKRSADPPAQHSFPTRRSSDLRRGDGAEVEDLHHRRVVEALRVGRLEDPAELVERAGIGEHHVPGGQQDRKSTRLNSSHVSISYAVFCLKRKIV